jgi:hypothetical protein
MVSSPNKKCSRVSAGGSFMADQYLLINRDEIAEPLARVLIGRYLHKFQPQWSHTDQYMAKCQKALAKRGLLTVDFNMVNDCISRDLEQFARNIKIFYKENYRRTVNWLAENLDRLDFDHDHLTQLVAENPHASIVKSLGLNILPGSKLICQHQDLLERHPDIVQAPAVIRNVINNEQLLSQKISQDLPFYFVDSGYTNFLEKKKIWHRLVRNHIHPDIYAVTKNYPADRLTLLPSMPEPWREPGNDIMVVLSSESYCNMWGCTQEEFKQKITDGLRGHTSRRIVFREKEQSRKTRQTVYERLQQEPDRWYCVISDSSAAAVEAIWCGVPVITLGRHITNSVSRNQLSMINDLYRGCLGNWLCALSYNQFTLKELYDGTAVRIMQKFYHA